MARRKTRPGGMMVSSVPTALRGSADIKKISKFIKTCRKQHGKVTFHGVNVICSIRSRYFVKKGEVVIASRYKIFKRPI